MLMSDRNSQSAATLTDVSEVENISVAVFPNVTGESIFNNAAELDTVDRQDELSAKQSNDTASGYMNAVKHTRPAVQQDCSGNSKHPADSENYITVTKKRNTLKKSQSLVIVKILLILQVL